MFRKTVDILEKEIGTSISNGLSKTEAKLRLEKNGENALIEKKPKTYFKMFIDQINEPIIYILLAAMVICLLPQINEVSDAIIIGMVVLLNAIIGVIQEGKAQASLAALKKLSVPICLVRRDGQVIELPSPELVVGDIVILEAGRTIPADLRLTFSSNLKIDESSLTGESVPVEKHADFVAEGDDLPLGDRLNMAYMTTTVSYGRGEGVVVATGMDTEIGNIAKLINEAGDSLTPLQLKLADLSKLLGIISLALCAILFVTAIIRGEPMLEMLIVTISLAVAAIPEGLPAVVTIVLAIGVQRLVKVNTIVKRLPSVETLGAVTVVCSDKTGTLTQNKMTIKEEWLIDDSFKDEFLNGFLLCSDASIDLDGNRIGDPTELAFLDLANTRDISKSQLDAKYPRIDELAFDSDRKMMTTLHKIDDKFIAYTKGATDQILELCDGLTKKQIEEINAKMSDMSNKALRVLALAKKEYASNSKLEETSLTFVGLMGMIDPPRPEAKLAIEQFKKASVRTIMITGDHKQTAFAIAKELGIATDISQCMEGTDITEETLAENIDKLSVFARVSPENKVQIVKALKAKGHIVSMTGDGVNDAPSLKTADIGVAMGITGTDVAKSAADMVLTDDNFATIEKAIVEGRGIYENIKKTVIFLLSSNMGEIICMLIAVLSGLPVPLQAIQILWVNLLTDSMPALALGVDENDKKQIMSKPPRKPKESLFAHEGWWLTFGYGTLIGLLTLSGFFIGLSHTATIGEEAALMLARTYAFSVLAVSQLFHAIGMRDIRQSVFKLKHSTNKLMTFAFFFGLALQWAVTEIPFLNEMFHTTHLRVNDWGVILSLAIVPVIVHEIVALFFKINKKKTA